MTTKTKSSKQAPAKKLAGVRIATSLDEALNDPAATAPSAEQESSLRERALLVRFSIGRWYGSGADEQVVNELRDAKGATGEIGSFTKRLMKREHLAGINRVTSDARKYHKAMTMPWGESGERVLSVEAFREYKEAMTTFEASFFKEVAAFMKKYTALVEAEKANLADLWKQSDYPSEEEMRENFRFGLAVDVLPSAKDLRLNLSEAHAAEIRKEIEQRMHESLVGALGDVYGRLAEHVKNAKEKLDDPEGRLQSRMFDGLQEVIALLPKLNIAGDARLTALGRELQKELVALPVAELRDDPVKRKGASEKAANMLGAIEALKKGGK